MIFPLRPPSLWRWWWRMFPLLPAGAMFWLGGWRPLRSPADLLSGLFSVSGPWVRFPGLDQPIRVNPWEVMRARVAFDRAQERAREKRRPEPEPERREGESVLAELARREAEARAKAEEEARRRAEQETERVSRTEKARRGYFYPGS